MPVRCPDPRARGSRLGNGYCPRPARRFRSRNGVRHGRALRGAGRRGNGDTGAGGLEPAQGAGARRPVDDHVLSRLGREIGDRAGNPAVHAAGGGQPATGAAAARGAGAKPSRGQDDLIIRSPIRAPPAWCRRSTSSSARATETRGTRPRTARAKEKANPVAGIGPLCRTYPGNCLFAKPQTALPSFHRICCPAESTTLTPAWNAPCAVDAPSFRTSRLVQTGQASACHRREAACSISVKTETGSRFFISIKPP